MTVDLVPTNALHMKTIYIFILFIIFSENNFAQNMLWVKKESSPVTPKNILCDATGNLYIYGSNHLYGVDPALPGFSYALVAPTLKNFLHKEIYYCIKNGVVKLFLFKK